MNKLALCKFILLLMPILCAGISVPAAADSEIDATIDAAIDSRAPEHHVLVMLHLPPLHFRPDANYASGYGDGHGRHARRRIAAELARAYGLRLVGDWPMPLLGVDCFVMQVPASESPSRVATLLEHDARTEWAQPMGVFHMLGHNDPLYPVQPSAKYWHLADLHTVTTGRAVRVAVIDSGVDDGHPDLLGQVALRENFIDGNPYAREAHGTAVAGIIAARADNGIGISGVAPNARLMALRACWQESADSTDTTRCSSFTLAKALHFAIMHEALVINLSLTGPSDRLLQRLLDVALARGIKVIGAIDPDSPGGGFPASYPGVWAVAGALPKGDGINVATNALTAPGNDIPTTLPGGRWGFVSGSSYAAAHVAGLAALLTELQRSLTPSQVRARLLASAPEPIALRMAGTINTCALVTWAAGTCPCLCAATHALATNQRP